MAGLNFVHKKGDTFDEVNFEVLVDAVALNLTGMVIRMQLRPECGGEVILSLTTVASAGLTIVNAALGLFKVNKQIINVPAGNYKYDIEFDYSGGDVRTWVSGEFLIECDITR